MCKMRESLGYGFQAKWKNRCAKYFYFAFLMLTYKKMFCWIPFKLGCENRIRKLRKQILTQISLYKFAQFPSQVVCQMLNLSNFSFYSHYKTKSECVLYNETSCAISVFLFPSNFYAQNLILFCGIVHLLRKTTGFRAKIA